MSIWLNEENIVNPEHGEAYINLGHIDDGRHSFRFHSIGKPAEFTVDQIRWGPVSNYRNRWTHHVITFDANGSNGAFCILQRVPTPNPDSGIIKSNDQLFLGGKNTNIEQLNLIVMAILTQQIGALQNGV